MKRRLKFHRDTRRLSAGTTFSCLLSVFVVLCLASSDARNYSEVVDPFGSGCPRLDSCAHQRSTGNRQLFVSSRERNCACDHLCPEYGDCCVDAPGNDAPPSAGSSNPPRCFELKQFGGVYMRDACPPSFGGPDDVRRLCEGGADDPSDPLGSMPATDPLTGLTYRNYYCGMCDDADDVVLWSPRLECPLLALLNQSGDVTDDYVVRNLATDGRRWGLYLGGENNGSLFFHDCDVDPVMPPLLEGRIRLCRPNLVSDCPPSWDGGGEVRRLCRAYMGARYLHGDGYRNVHCAVCNDVNATLLSCQSAEQVGRDMDIFRTFATHSFALLLDINEKRGQQVGKIRVCEGGEVFDPFFKKCRSLTCLPGFVRRGRKCARRRPQANSTRGEPPSEYGGNVTFERTADVPDLNLSSGESDNVSDSAGRKFLDCLLISLADEDYVRLPNRTIFVPKYDRLYEPTSYFASSGGSVLVCAHFASRHEAKFLPALGYVTIAGLSLSMLFLALHFAAFCVVPDLRNLSGKNLTSQCASLFLAYACFVAGQFESLAGASCSAVAFLTFYFFQVSFFWMAAMAYDVWRTLRMATTELRVSGGRQVKRFAAYSLFAWTTPLLLVAAVALAEYTDALPAPYRPGFAAGSSTAPCWFRRRRSLLAFFAAPLFAVMLANVLLFAASARMIVATAGRQQSRPQRRDFRLYLRLALLMGLTWVTGLVAGCADAPFLFHLFVVLNTLQGLFIFAAFTCSSKVLGFLRGRFKRSKGFKSSTSTTTAHSALSTQRPAIRS